MSRSHWCAVLCGLLVFALSGGTASAASCASSTPSSASYADPSGDTVDAADLVSGTLTVDANCNLTLSYAVGNQTQMYDGDIVTWFIDTDHSTATGSPSGFSGADYAVYRIAGDYAWLGKWDAAGNAYKFVKQVQAAGPFGAQLSLSDLDPAPGATFAIAGASLYADASTPPDLDFAPDWGVAPVLFGVQFSSPPPPPSAPPAPDPTPAPAPAPTAPPVVPQSTAPTCTVPHLKGLSFAAAKHRLAAAHCTVGKHSVVTSKTLADKVVRTTPNAGTTMASGAPVNVVLGRSAHRSRAKKAQVRHAATATAELVNRLSYNLRRALARR